MKKQSIFVKNYVTYCSIGIYPNEKVRKQKTQISVNLEIINVQKKDNINSTVSYEKIISVLDEIKNYNHINLLETLATKISSRLEKIKNIKKLKIKIVKCSILSGKQGVGITYKKKLKNN